MAVCAPRGALAGVPLMLTQRPDSRRPIGGRYGRWVGAAMLIHFVFVVGVVNFVRHAPADVFWLSHSCLLLGAMGLLFRSPVLVTTALTLVGIPHLVWIVDSTAGLALGWFPLGVTEYIMTADPWTRVATSHHFYLVPLLFVVAWRYGEWPRATLPIACAILLALTAAARVASTPQHNVNYMFRVEAVESHPFVAWVNALGTVPYLLFVDAFMVGLMLVPVALLMRRHAREEHTGGATSDSRRALAHGHVNVEHRPSRRTGR